MKQQNRTCEAVVASTTVAVAVAVSAACHKAFGPWAAWLAVIPGLVLGFVLGAGVWSLKVAWGLLKKSGR